MILHNKYSHEMLQEHTCVYERLALSVVPNQSEIFYSGVQKKCLCLFNGEYA